MADKRLHVYYAGSVQGVGFRYTAECSASSCGLTGWVKNLDDGRVEIVCEGTDQAIRAFLARIDEVFKNYIRDAAISWSAATGEFGSFDIRF